MEAPRILVIGAGPTGLGACWRLEELGHSSWKLLDGAPYPGGLATSIVDDQGFTWDLGGHVLFSHYEYFDRLMDHLLGDAWVEHEREAWVWMRDRFIPYPLQYNIWRLDPEELIPCVEGLLDQHKAAVAGTRPGNFEEWILRNFGRGLADVFMLPYNFKVWAYEPAKLDVGWMGERVATVDLARLLRNIIRRTDDCGWGPNATFRFPLRGGTGAIWRALCDRLPSERISFGRAVRAVDVDLRRVVLADGSVEEYDRLVSTMPLDNLLHSLLNQKHLSARASELVYSSSHVVGIGLDGCTPEHLGTKCWMYFPEPDVPFYRVTVFSNYSPNNVARPGEQWSLMAEVSESRDKPVHSDRVVEEVVAGLVKAKLVPDASRIVSRWHRRLGHGYPTPFHGRDELLQDVEPELRRMGIYSRGRFGGWKYEVSNQDHSLMQGVEAIDHILFGAEETTYRFPSVVNAQKNLGRAPKVLERAEARV